MSREQEQEDMAASLQKKGTQGRTKRRGYPKLLENAGHMGQLLLPVMRDRYISISQVVKAIGLRRDVFSDIVTGRQTELSIGHVLMIARVVGVSEKALLAAYIQDATDFYPDILRLVLWLREAKEVLPVDPLGGTSFEIYNRTADLVYLLYLYDQIPDDKKDAFFGVNQSLVESIHPDLVEKLAAVRRTLGRRRKAII